MKNDNCIFCKISDDIIQSTKLYEDKDFFVIPDINPASKGHCLIIAKEHYANIFDMPDEQIAKAHSLAKKLATKLMDAFGCDGINILQNNFEAAGQTVFHYHIHVIPRYEQDFVGLNWNPQTIEDTTLNILKKIFE